MAHSLDTDFIRGGREAKMLRKSVLILAFFVAACSGGGGAKVDLVPVATELRPTPDGYSFANFGAGASPEEFVGNDLVKMFGAEACVGGVVSPCEPIAEAAAWARMVNQARSSGHCEGIVVEASQRFDLSLLPPTVDLVNEGEVTHEIIRTFATQFLPEVQVETIKWGKQSLKAIVAALVESFKTGKSKYSMGLYTDQGGHAVLPYAIEFPTADQAVIQIYDSNWPGKNRFVDVDLKTEQWTFSFSGADPKNDPNVWTGGNGYMDLTSLDTRNNSTCPFCASKSKVKNSMIVISSVDTNWSVTNKNGTYSPSKNQTVEGITARPIRGSVAPNNYRALEYVVYVDGFNLELDLPNATSAFVSQGNAVVQVSTNSQNNKTISVTQDAISVDDPNVTIKIASGDLVAEVAGYNTVIDIAKKQLGISVESNSGQKIEAIVNQETPAVSARVVDNGTASTATNFVVTTQTNDNQVQVREVARDGSESVTVKQATAQTDLNQTKIDLPAVLVVSDTKPGLPSVESRDLKNPEYKADVAFVATQGLVVSKLAETLVLSTTSTVDTKNTAPEFLASLGPTNVITTTTTTTLPPTTTSTTTTTTLPPTTTTSMPVVRTTSTTTTTVPPTTTTSSTTTTTSSTTTTTSSTTTTTSSTITSTTVPTTTTTTTVPTTTTTTTVPTTTTTTTVAPSTYSVSYNGNTSTSGAVPSDVSSYSSSATVTVAGNSGSLAKTGYTFGGWCTTQSAAGAACSGTPRAAASTFTITASTTLYAQWTANSLTVTTDEQGGSAISNASTTTGGSMSSPGTPTRSGYTFTGWFTAATGGSAITFAYAHGETANFTLYAQWTLAAPAFTLSSSSESKVQNTAIGGYTITSTGGAIASYAISPAAPTGLTFNTSTGLLSGTPTTVQTATSYTITATNATSTATQTFTLTVTVTAPAFTLSSSSESKVQNTAIAGYSITSTGGAIASYAISPSAPTGLTFNTSTGLLSGTPTTVQTATAYTITATNATSTATQTFTLTVTVTAPAFTLSSGSESKVQNTAITGYTISSTGGTIASYAISPAAPAGLTFNTSTGLLSGTPTTVQTATGYTITATNATGTATQTFTLTVTAATCANGGACIVGDTGPGGGVVFYDAGSVQSWGRYLEAAPANATSTTWCNNTSTARTGTFSRAIGSGAMNTYLMLDGCTSGAAYNATGYSNNGYSNWYLPSILDLYQMCTNRATLGMTSAGTFKSSSQDTVNAGIHAETWNFPGSSGTCANDNWGKSLTQGVRPIRAIGDTTAPTASVTTASISASGSATIQSTEIGRGFLVNTSITVTNLASITGASGSLWNAITITTADTDTSLAATGLSAGTYKVYTIDQSGNLSAVSSNSVTIS